MDRIAETSAAGELPVVVFDLDSTLFSTEPRNYRIIEEFAAAHGAEYEGLQELIEGLQLSDMGWGVAEPFLERGFNPPGFKSALSKFWGKRFFTSPYVVLDHPTPGAVEFACACHERGAMIYYLTGRHVSDMGAGTVQALTDAGFPLWRGRCPLHLKPSFEMADKPFKDEAIRDIRSNQGLVVATFENEPGNANLFYDAFPGALHFLLETIHSTEAEVPYQELLRGEDFLLS
ncbi:MAG: hypothetical protein CMP23_11225 [Rickettsiales bacterium]|nr:hypothetical protein [Rickettsiales bacterium]